MVDDCDSDWEYSSMVGAVALTANERHFDSLRLFRKQSGNVPLQAGAEIDHQQTSYLRECILHSNRRICNNKKRLPERSKSKKQDTTMLYTWEGDTGGCPEPSWQDPSMRVLQ